MKNIVLLLIVTLISCSDDNGNNPSNTNIDVGVSFYLKNASGENLLNTSNYISDNFRIFNVINGEVQEVNMPQMDYPRNFFINDETTPISMRLFLNHTENEEFPITYIKWNQDDTDTIKADFDRGTTNEIDYIICKKIWYNDQLVWDTTTPAGITGREITVTK